MNSATVTSSIGILLWALTLVVIMRTAGVRRNIPNTLLWPGYIATLPAAFVLRGLLGEASLALPTLTACACGLFALSGNGRRALAAFVAVGLCLYISALGLISFDLYGLGYFPTWEMLAVVILLTLAYRYLPILAWAWLCSLGLFASGLLPSPNIWDALIDLPSAILAAYLILRGPRNQSCG